VKARRRRGLLLLAVALAAGGLAASQVRQREQSVEARVGPLVGVLVAARDLPADTRVSERSVELRQVPARYVAPDALGSAGQVEGARTAVPVAAGSYLTPGHFTASGAGGPGAGAGAGFGRGERAVEVEVTGTSGLTGAAAGARVDVVVSTEPAGSGGRSFVALADVELLGLRDGSGAAAYGTEGEEAASSAGIALATLRVTVRQAVYLTAADNFGREIRLLVRPPGDRSSTGADVSASEL
jgi:pilus assembly protein CpaB